MRVRLALRPARFAALACAAALGLLTSPAAAQADADRATARSLGNNGQQALDNHDFRSAEDLFRRADSLVHAPTLMLGLARALAGEGKYVEAQEGYNRIIREGVAPGAPEPFRRALADAKKEVDAVSSKISGVTITVRSPDGADLASPTVTLDGAPVNGASLGVRRSINPGSHVLQATADGYKPADLHFDVAEAGSANAALTLEPLPSAPVATPAAGPAGAETAGAGPAPATGSGASSSGASVWPWIGFGLGGAGLATGAVTGLLAMSKHSDLSNSGHCKDTICDASQQGNVDAFHTLATVSTVGFIVGGVGVAAGVVFLFVQPGSGSHAAQAAQGDGGDPAKAPRTGVHVVPTLGLGSIGAVGEF